MQLIMHASSPTDLQLKTIDFKVPKEVWSDKSVDYSVLKIFGYPTYIHVQSGEQSKFDPKLRKCIFLV
jgi:hypothetical protein